ncbi:prepilin peptidase [Streptomyces sp. IBSBF 2806]|uniref:prepilin peptidase n=1 Tax=Streptomyces sp. IBSBF 2806 TaxID=2903529 RepID=UPI002FDBF0F3
MTGVRPEVVVWLLLVPAGVLLAVVDVASRRLPDVLILALAVGVLALLGIAALLPGAGGSWMSALFGSFIVGACSLVVFLVSRGFGFGDVKLALLLGAVLGWYGWPVVVVGMFAGYLFGALYGMALVFAGRAGRRARIAFGPFLLAGAFVGVLWGSYAQ